MLFLLSRKMSKALSKFLSINFLSFIFLPGVIIHELSHLLMAVILFVSVGDMEFTPKISSSGIKLGSIEIAKTDPIRRSIIGFAPVFVGLMIVVGIVYVFTSNIVFYRDKETYVFAAVVLALTYILFSISNTMFSSRRDMEGTIEILATLLIIFIVSYFIGFRPSFSFAQNLFTKEIVDLIKQASLFLLAPIFVDLLILGVIRVFNNK